MLTLNPSPNIWRHLKATIAFCCQGMKAEGTAHKHAAHQSNGQRDEMKSLHSDYGFDEPIWHIGAVYLLHFLKVRVSNFTKPTLFTLSEPEYDLDTLSRAGREVARFAHYFMCSLQELFQCFYLYAFLLRFLLEPWGPVHTSQEKTIERIEYRRCSHGTDGLVLT